MPDEKLDPVREFTNMRDTFSRAVEKRIRNVAGIAVFPEVDVYEDATNVIIRTEPLLGIDKTSIEVSMENGILAISGATHDNLDLPDRAFLQRELQFGAFQRSLRIPRKVDVGSARARFEGNMLLISLPKIAGSDNEIIDVTPAK